MVSTKELCVFNITVFTPPERCVAANLQHKSRSRCDSTLLPSLYWKVSSKQTRHAKSG